MILKEVKINLIMYFYLFELIIIEIQTKYIDDKNVIETKVDSQKQRIELLEKNNLDQEKKDMWDD